MSNKTALLGWPKRISEFFAAAEGHYWTMSPYSQARGWPKFGPHPSFGGGLTNYYNYYIVKYNVHKLGILEWDVGRAPGRAGYLSRILPHSSEPHSVGNTQLQDFGGHYCWEWLGNARYLHLESPLHRASTGYE